MAKKTKTTRTSPTILDLHLEAMAAASAVSAALAALDAAQARYRAAHAAYLAATGGA